MVKPSGSAHSGAQRLTDEQLRHGVWRAVLDREVVARDDARMREGGDRAGLVLELREGLRLEGAPVVHHLGRVAGCASSHCTREVC